MLLFEWGGWIAARQSQDESSRSLTSSCPVTSLSDGLRHALLPCIHALRWCQGTHGGMEGGCASYRTARRNRAAL